MFLDHDELKFFEIELFVELNKQFIINKALC